uniref:Uncharacterized protein n=1 Tax=Arion vulgaris TaxID=1028688 RepID=A0A0B7ACL1_9EUPU
MQPLLGHHVAVTILYCRISGNETVDQLVKEGAAACEQLNVPVACHEKKLMIKSIRKPPILELDDYQTMNRLK